VGVDAAPGMIAAAHRSGNGVGLLVGRAEDLAFADASFDVVSTTMSFHHWRDQAAGLHEIHRVLRPDGVLILSDMVLRWWMLPFAHLSGARSRTHTSSEFRALLVAAGYAPLPPILAPRLRHAVQVMPALLA
jgi:ubiquinone/menaquinone biosynthesis C-methylase UbiE